MTKNERINHVYHVGDKAVIMYRDDCWDKQRHPPVGEIVTIEEIMPEGLHYCVRFMWNGTAINYHQEYIEPVAKATAKQCTCSIVALMATGCTCGGC